VLTSASKVDIPDTANEAAPLTAVVPISAFKSNFPVISIAPISLSAPPAPTIPSKFASPFP